MNRAFDDYILGSIFSSMTIIEKSKIKRVCKRWNTIIGDILLIHHNYPHQIVRLPELMKMEASDILNTACYCGNLCLVKFVLNGAPIQGALDWNRGLSTACFGERIRTIPTKGAIDLNNILTNACRGERAEIVDLLISKGATNLNWGLCIACSCGCIEIVKLLISRGADALNLGLTKACIFGYLDVAKVLILAGGDAFSDGLRLACLGKHSDIVKLMISKGATHCECGLSIDEHMKK